MFMTTRGYLVVPFIAARKIAQRNILRKQIFARGISTTVCPNVQKSRMLRTGAILTLAGISLAYSATPTLAAGDKFRQSMVFGTKVRMSLTEEELAEMRRRSQEHIAFRKKTEPGCRITDQELLMLSKEFLVNASRRIQASDVATLADLSRRAEKEVTEWFQAASSNDPVDIARDLKVRFYCVYTDEELRLIARSPKCLAALHAGNVLTSAEVRKYASTH
jgi:hypothetical protein